MAAFAAAAVGIVLSPAAVVQAHADTAHLPHLIAIHPGSPQLRVTPIKVNVVLVGYPAGSIDTQRLVSMLPVEGVPIERLPLYRGSFFAAGVDFQYHYAVTRAGTNFNDAFFSHLAHSGSLAAPDHYQSVYNAQPDRNRTVGPAVRYIDASSTESWLERNAASSLNINPRDYTVFLVDWFDRPDFQYHVYTNPSHRDPDTGTDARVTLAQTHVRAWGGSSGPTWFLDLSAGPVYTDGSFDITVADLNGTGSSDYRLPPIWDYGHTGYRSFDDLTGDLAKTIRYAAIDGLFAAAPLFDPLATFPLPGGGKTIALDIFEGDPNRNGRKDVHPDLVQAYHQALEPYVPLRVSVRDLPLSGGALTAYQIGTGLSTAPDCWNSFGSPVIEFDCHFLGNYPVYFPTATQDAVIPEVGFTVADNPSQRIGFQGNTDDDFATGAPALIEAFDDAPLHASPKAYGYTLLATHEAGHFVGLSHPHDGQDSEQHIDFGPDGSFFLAWAGDESATVMSYLPGNYAFDIFDVDNLARTSYGREADNADYFAGLILARPPNGAAYGWLAAADAELQAADIAIRSEHWLDAGTDSYKAFDDVLRAAQADGLIPSSARAAAAAGTSQASAVAAIAPGEPGPRVVVAPGEQPCIATDACPVIIRGSGR